MMGFTARVWRLPKIAQRFNAGLTIRTATSPGGTKEAELYMINLCNEGGFCRPFWDLCPISTLNPALKRWAIVS